MDNQYSNAPLGTVFKNYENNKSINYWLLDPIQYPLNTQYNYNISEDFSMESLNGSIKLDDLVPLYTTQRKSANDFTSDSYKRFLANDGYFNPNDSSDLWFNGAEDKPYGGGASLNVQEVIHIVFPEPQRGGINTKYNDKNIYRNCISEK